MNIKNQKAFIDELNQKMVDNSEQGFEFFKESWPKLDDDDRKMLNTIITVGIGRILAIAEIPLEDQLYWLAIANHIEKVEESQTEDSSIFPRLVLREGTHYNQIIKLFFDLRNAGIIESPDELIAEAINLIFPIEYSTAYKGLTEKNRLAKVKKLLF